MGIFKKKDDFNDKIDAINNMSRKVESKTEYPNSDASNDYTPSYENLASPQDLSYAYASNNIYNDIIKSIRESTKDSIKFTNKDFETFFANTFDCIFENGQNYQSNTMANIKKDGSAVIEFLINNPVSCENFYFVFDGSSFSFTEDENNYNFLNLNILGAYALFLDNLKILNDSPKLSNQILSSFNSLSDNNEISFNFCGVRFSVKQNNGSINLTGKLYCNEELVFNEKFSSLEQCVDYINSNSPKFLHVYKDFYQETIKDNFPNILSNYISHNYNIPCDAKYAENSNNIIVDFKGCEMTIDQENGIFLEHNIPQDVAYDVFNTYLLARNVSLGKDSIPSSEEILSKVESVFSNEPTDFRYFGIDYKIMRRGKENFDVIKHNMYNQEDKDSLLFSDITADKIKNIYFADVIRAKTEAFFDFSKTHTSLQANRIDIENFASQTNKKTSMLLSSDDDLSL